MSYSRIESVFGSVGSFLSGGGFLSFLRIIAVLTSSYCSHAILHDFTSSL